MEGNETEFRDMLDLSPTDEVMDTLVDVFELSLIQANPTSREVAMVVTKLLCKVSS